MQAVILAAGKSSRLYPLADGFHKSMITLLGKPILRYTIEGLKEVGVKDLIIVVGSDDAVSSYFGDGKKIGVNITYVKQVEPLGMGNALLHAKNHITGEFFLLNAYHADVSKFIDILKNKKNKETKAILLVKKRLDTWTQGVLKVNNGKIVDIIEKPDKGKEPSSLCIAGIYCFSKDFISVLESTPKEHYQLEAAISYLAKERTVEYVETEEKMVTLKYPWDILSFKDYLLNNINKHIGKNVSIAKSAEIIGDVVIEDGVRIMEGARIKGPCFMGKNSYVGTNAIIRDGVCMEENSVIGANMEVKNSCIFKGSTTHSGFIGDSIIGENCKIGGQFCTANVRLDRTPIQVHLKENEVETGLKSLGAIIGSNVGIGIKTSTMPGVIIGNNVVIGPSTVVLKNIDDNMKYLTRFKEIVEERR